MTPVLDEICRTGYVLDPEGNRLEAFPCGVWAEEGRVLYDIVRRTKADRTLEIGLAYGISTLFICQAHHDKGSGHHVAIDPEERDTWQSIGLANLRRAGLDHLVTLDERPDYLALPALLLEGERFDFVFVDGLHLFDHVLIDFFYADLLLEPGGVIAFHDLWMPSTRRAMKFILRNRRYRLATDLLGKPASVRTQLLRIARCPPEARKGIVLQNPFGRLHLGRIGLRGLFNYCVLEKLRDDDRDWYHHRSF